MTTKIHDIERWAGVGIDRDRPGHFLRFAPYKYRKIPLGEGHSPEFRNSNPVLLGIGLSISKLNPERSPTGKKKSNLAGTARPSNSSQLRSEPAVNHLISVIGGKGQKKQKFIFLSLLFPSIYLVGEG